MIRKSGEELTVQQNVSVTYCTEKNCTEAKLFHMCVWSWRRVVSWCTSLIGVGFLCLCLTVRSCCMEMAAGSALLPSPNRRAVQLRPPKRSAPRRRRKPAHRRRKRDEKRACRDTMEESHLINYIQTVTIQSLLTCHADQLTPLSHRRFSIQQHLLFRAPPFDNPTTPLIARRHSHEFPRLFASPAASGSRALLPGRATKSTVGTQEFALVRQ